MKDLLESDLNIFGQCTVKVLDGKAERIPPEEMDFETYFMKKTKEVGFGRRILPPSGKVAIPKETPRQKRKKQARKEARERLLAAGRHDNLLLECDLDFIVDMEVFEDRYEEVGLPAYQAMTEHYGALIWEEIELRQFCVLQKATWRDTMRLEYLR